MIVDFDDRNLIDPGQDLPNVLDADGLSIVDIVLRDEPLHDPGSDIGFDLFIQNENIIRDTLFIQVPTNVGVAQSVIMRLVVDMEMVRGSESGKRTEFEFGMNAFELRRREWTSQIGVQYRNAGLVDMHSFVWFGSVSLRMPSETVPLGFVGRS